MATVTELVFAEQFGYLRQIAESRGWDLEQIDGPGFILGLPARDGSRFWLKVDCDGYATAPPAWHWYDSEMKALDQPGVTPAADGHYFHTSGRICAPWNRLAYSQVDPKGPHGDWQLGNWMTNPNTKGCTTLSAMVLRLAVELRGPHYKGRMG